MKLSATHETSGFRGYWKFNNSLLKDDSFNDSIKKLAEELLNDDLNDNYRIKWEFFKYKARCVAVKRSKEIKKEKSKVEAELMHKLHLLLTKININLEEELEIRKIQLQLDQMYLDLAKGAFIRSRAKWLEEGEKNTSYFFALEKRNFKRKSLSALNIDGVPSKDPKLISNFVTKFYRNLYESQCNASEIFLIIFKLSSLRLMRNLNHYVNLTCQSMKLKMHFFQ